MPVSIIRTPYVERVGTKAGPVARALLQHPRAKHWMRMFYSLQSIWQLKRASLQGVGYKEYFQAGKSVAGIRGVEPAGDVVRRFAEALRAETTTAAAG
jgi:nitronate monooxygenase